MAIAQHHETIYPAGVSGKRRTTGGAARVGPGRSPNDCGVAFDARQFSPRQGLLDHDSGGYGWHSA